VPRQTTFLRDSRSRVETLVRVLHESLLPAVPVRSTQPASPSRCTGQAPLFFHPPPHPTAPTSIFPAQPLRGSQCYHYSPAAYSLSQYTTTRLAPPRVPLIIARPSPLQSPRPKRAPAPHINQAPPPSPPHPAPKGPSNTAPSPNVTTPRAATACCSARPNPPVRRQRSPTPTSHRPPLPSAVRSAATATLWYGGCQQQGRRRGRPVSARPDAMYGACPRPVVPTVVC
jgi:hypothetical protein